MHMILKKQDHEQVFYTVKPLSLEDPLELHYNKNINIFRTQISYSIIYCSKINAEILQVKYYSTRKWKLSDISGHDL